MVKKERVVEVAVLIIVVVTAVIGLFLLFKEGTGELFGQAVSLPDKGVLETPAPSVTSQKTVNQLTQVLLRDSTRPSKQQLVDVSVAAQRKEKLLELMEKNPTEALRLVIPKDVRNKFRSEVQANIEEEVELEGTLEVLHVDNFVNYGSSKYLHFLRVGEKRISLHSDQDLLGVMPVISGSTVRTKGAKLGNKLISKGTSENFKVLAEEKPHASEQRTIVILAEFTDKKFTTDISVVREALGKVDAYYRENSYNDTFFSFEIVGPVNTGVPQSHALDGIANDNFFPISTAALESLDPSVDFRQFDKILIFFPAESETTGAGTIGPVGVSVDGGITVPIAWLPERDLNGVMLENTMPPCCPANIAGIAHEFGHNFGLFHANRLTCPNFLENGLTHDCNSVNYGDPFDVMGGGGVIDVGEAARLPVHMNAYHKNKIGWLEGSNIVVTNGGTYTIEPLETDGQGIKLIMLPYGDDFYHIEYRQSIGFDRGMDSSVYSGALLHLAPRYIGRVGPGSDSNIVAAGIGGVIPLAVGQTYTDSHVGYKISVVESTLEGLKVQISSPFTVDPVIDGVRIAGPVAQTPTLFAGRTAVFTVVLKNNGNADAIKVGVNINNEVTGEIIGSAIATVIPAGGSAEVDISWVPPQPGRYELSAEISPPLPGDTNLGNNKVLLPTDVISP
jgi:M6 family metalloprotease-like protein